MIELAVLLRPEQAFFLSPETFSPPLGPLVPLIETQEQKQHSRLRRINRTKTK